MDHCVADCSHRIHLFNADQVWQVVSMTKPLKREQKVAVTLQRWQWQHINETVGMFVGCPECMDIEHLIIKRLQGAKHAIHTV